MDALEVELDGGHPVLSPTTVELGESWVVKIFVGRAPPLGGEFRCVNPILEIVVALEPGSMDDVVGHPAARTAELEFGIGVDETRRNRQSTVITRDHRGIISWARALIHRKDRDDRKDHRKGHRVVEPSHHRGSTSRVVERGAIFCHCSEERVVVIDGRWFRTMLKVAPAATSDESINLRGALNKIL